MRYPEIRQLSAFSAFKSDGTVIPAIIDATNGPGMTLGVATYLIPLGGERYGSIVETTMASLSAKWPSGIAGTITIEATNFPKTMTCTDQGPADITDWDITSGAWQKIDPTLAGSVYAIATGTGSMTKYTCTVTAGVGAAFWNIPEIGSLRLRANIAVTTGGFIRFFGHSKLGS
jgi:hypothetical protein